MLLSELNFQGDQYGWWELAKFYGGQVWRCIKKGGSTFHGGYYEVGEYCIELHKDNNEEYYIARRWEHLDAITAQAVLFELLGNNSCAETHK